MTSPYQDLVERKRALEFEVQQLNDEIEKAQAANRDVIVRQIMGLMSEHGLSFADLRVGSGPAVRVRSARRAGSKAKGVPVAAKYRDPQTQNAWSGRGLTPNWLKNHLQQGRKLEEFAVSKG